MTDDDRKFLSTLADCLANADRIRIKGEGIADIPYVLITDEQANSLACIIHDLIQRDTSIAEAKTQLDEYLTHSFLN
jgi:hypothetical protein